MTQYVICALQMEGFHCWPEADGELAYLLKACLALLDTPFFYFFTRNADRR